jgi:hypothetical protein
MTSKDRENSDISGFAAVINSRLAAEALISRATALTWFCGGLAIAVLLTGFGFAAAFYGYGHMISVRPAAEETARVLAEAFERAKLKTAVSGVMSLAPNSEVVMASSQTVKLEDRATIKLDPNSSIRVVGDLKLDMPQPSKHQLQLSTPNGTEELPFTNYTIFKDVTYGAGLVVTGWHFDLSDTTRPRFQYCYYSQPIEKGVSSKYTIALNGSPQRPSSLAKLSFNFDEAVTNCIWFSGL